MSLRWYRAELHVHTVLSPCAAVEMIPPFIVQAALNHGIDVLAITDHNTSANVAAVQQAASGTNLHVLPGMELQTIEEVHVLCLFEHLAAIQSFQEWVDANLPNVDNDPEYFGEQFIVDKTGEFLQHEHRLLLNSCSVSFDQAVDKVHSLDGLAIPAHVDRTAFGLYANLGFIPPHIQIDAAEISARLSQYEAPRRYPQLDHYPLLQGGDVHHLSDFLGANWFFIERPTIKELRLAMQHQEGRLVEIRHLGMDNLQADV